MLNKNLRILFPVFFLLEPPAQKLTLQSPIRSVLSQRNKISFLDSDLRKSMMNGMEFNHFRFENTNISESDLRASRFQEGVFKNVELINSDLRQTRFNRVRFEKVNFSDSTFDDSVFLDCIFIDSTIPPELKLRLDRFNNEIR